MKILVTGSRGQLGMDCVSVFSKEHSVSGKDLPELDITDPLQVKKTFEALRPDAVVNCAAFTAVDACESDPLCRKVNAEGPGILAEEARKTGVFLVHISTDYVFDGKKPLFEAYTEDDIPSPVSEYGKSKRAGEEAVLESGAESAILRTAWLYGTHGKNFLKTILRLALRNSEKELRIVNDQFGSPVWSHTLARQIAAVIQARAAGIFHATSEGYCSWYEFAKHFLEQMDVPHRIVPCATEDYPVPAVRPKNSILENAALKKRGLNLFRDWREDLKPFAEKNRVRLIREAKEDF